MIVYNNAQGVLHEVISYHLLDKSDVVALEENTP